MDRAVTILALGAAFLLYAGGSLLWSLDPLWGSAWLLSLVGAFVLGTWLIDLRRVWIGYVWFIACNIALIFCDLSFGLFGNANIFGCAVALAIAGALAYEYALWFTLPMGLAALAYAESRGALLGVGVALFIWLWRKRWVYGVVGVAAAIGAVYFLSSPHRDNGTLARLGIWQDTLNHLTILGSGWGSFAATYAAFPIHTNMTLILAPHAYNDALELMFELGIGAIPLWWLIALALEGADPAQRLIAWTFLALGLTFFPLHLFPLAQMFALTLGAMLAPQLERLHYGTLATHRGSLSQS